MIFGVKCFGVNVMYVMVFGVIVMRVIAIRVIVIYVMDFDFIVLGVGGKGVARYAPTIVMIARDFDVSVKMIWHNNINVNSLSC